MNERFELAAKGLLGAMALLAILWRHWAPGRLAPEQAGRPLWILAGAAALAWLNFGIFHGGSVVHHWEHFHYFLGSKYAPEIRYDGLYDASLAAELELKNAVHQPFIRDLADNQIVPTAARIPDAHGIRSRFSPARWQEFTDDTRYFLAACGPEYLRKIRLDHGYNPSPTWTFAARLFSGRMRASLLHLTLLSTLDLLLLAATFYAVFRTFGSRRGCLCLIAFGLGYPWRYHWVGGAFLRHDWLAAVGLGLCLLKRERAFAAGALLGYAAMVRLFPLGFLLGLPVVAAREFFRGEKPRWFVRLAAGVAVAVVLGGLAGSRVETGWTAWRDFAANLSKHGRTWLTNNVGLKNLVLYDRVALSGRDVDRQQPDPWARWQARLHEREQSRRALLVGAQAFFLAWTVAAMRKLRPCEASLMGTAIVFAMLAPTGYYWSVLAFLPLARGGWRLAAGWLAINSGLIWLHFQTPLFERIYGAMSWALAALLLAWAIRTALGARPETQPAPQSP